MTHLLLMMILISPDLGRALTTEVFSLSVDQLRDQIEFSVSVTASHSPAEQTIETLAPSVLCGAMLPSLEPASDAHQTLREVTSLNTL